MIGAVPGVPVFLAAGVTDTPTPGDGQGSALWKT